MELVRNGGESGLEIGCELGMDVFWVWEDVSGEDCGGGRGRW
jgi:hypothetical protein